MPTEIDVIEREIMQHEMERQALKKEKDPASKERLKKLEKELAELKEKSNALKAEWQRKKQFFKSSENGRKNLTNFAPSLNAHSAEVFGQSKRNPVRQNPGARKEIG